MYKATYKCRMCGETFDGVTLDSGQVKDMLPIALHDSFGLKRALHDCSDGSIGYADFVGFRKENDDGQEN